MRGATYTIKCARTGDTYIRTDENIFDDIFDILDYNNDGRLYHREETTMTGRLNGGSMDDSYLGEAEGVRQILAWVLNPGFIGERTNLQIEALEDLLKRIQEAEATTSRWRGLQDYPSL